MGDDAAPQYKVFVGGLTWDLTNEQLQEGEGVGVGCPACSSAGGALVLVQW